MSFWDVFFLLLIYVPLLLMWTSALFDIFRRDDLSGVSKAIWVATVIIVPFIGTLVYLVFRPAGATPQERAAGQAVNPDVVAPQSTESTAQQLSLLADLQERGALTAEEFAAEKARVLGGSSGA